jgi:hypothetical protein
MNKNDISERCVDCGQEWSCLDSAAPKIEAPITLRQARRTFGRDMVQRMLVYGKHHHDDKGEPIWLPDDAEDAIGLAEIEQSREEAACP